MRDRRLTCRGLVDAYIRRINAYDKNGPAINAIVTINPDAIKDADEMDRRFAQSGLTGPLALRADDRQRQLRNQRTADLGRRARVCRLSAEGRRVSGGARKSGGRDCAGEIQHGRVGVQSRRDGQFDSARLHEEPLRAGSGDGGVERRHGGIDRGQLRTGRVRQRYRQFDSRTVIPSVSRGHSLHDGAHQPRRRVSSEHARRCSRDRSPAPWKTPSRCFR